MRLDRLIGIERSRRRAAIGADPQLRTAARRVAAHHREQVSRQRPWAVPFLLVMAVLTVRLAVDRSPLYVVGTLVSAGALAAHLVVPRRLERRAQEPAAPVP